MHRRRLLAAVATGSGAVVAGAGCLADRFDPARTGTDDGRSPGTNAASTSAADECGVGDEPLAALLTDDPGDGDACPSDPSPSFAVENDRDEQVRVIVTFGDGGSFERTYDLEPGDRAVEGRGVPTKDGLRATVVVESEDGDPDESTATWDHRSCKRHAVVVSEDGLETGYVDPIAGPIDTQHDCYAGDVVPIRVYNDGATRAVTVRVDDRCAGERVEERLSLEPDDVERVDDAIENGGVFDVTLELADGTAETYRFHEECWGLSASIDADGAVTIGRLAID